MSSTRLRLIPTVLALGLLSAGHASLLTGSPSKTEHLENMQFRAEPGNSAVYRKSAITSPLLHQVWQSTLPSWTPPTPFQGRLYLGTSAGVTALDQHDGSVLWTCPVPGYVQDWALACEVRADGQTYIYGFCDGYPAGSAFCVRGDGVLSWVVTLNHLDVESHPTLANGQVIFAATKYVTAYTVTGVVMSLDKHTGATRFTHVDNNMTRTDRLAYHKALHRYFYMDNGYVTCKAEDGHIVWRVSIPFDSRYPLVLWENKNLLYVPGWNQGEVVTCLDSDTGVTLWTRGGPDGLHLLSEVPITLGYGRLYLGTWVQITPYTTASYPICLDALTGQVLWQCSEAMVPSSSFADTRGRVWYTSNREYLCVDAATGASLAHQVFDPNYSWSSNGMDSSSEGNALFVQDTGYHLLRMSP